MTGAERLRPHRVAEQLDCPLLGDDLSRRRNFGELPREHDWRARDGRVHGGAWDDDLARFDCNTRLELWERTHRAANLHRRSDSAERVVFVSLGNAEDREQLVPGETFDGAAVIFDRSTKLVSRMRGCRPVVLCVEISRCEHFREKNRDRRASFAEVGRPGRRETSRRFGRSQARVLSKDRLLERTERRPGLDSELLHERAAQLPVGVQRLRLPA